MRVDSLSFMSRQYKSSPLALYSKAYIHGSSNSCEKAIKSLISWLDFLPEGYHEKVSEQPELWGMGDDWIMWIDRDFI